MILPTLNLTGLRKRPAQAALEPGNEQTAEVFEAEKSLIDAASTALRWIAPSADDADRAQVKEVIAVEAGDAPETELPVGAGRVRGLVLHKLMEELLTGELAEEIVGVEMRARTLISELASEIEGAPPPEPIEAATTALRTLKLPEITNLRAKLVPEWPIYGLLSDRRPPAALAGRVDAVAIEAGKVEIVIDWKSDVDPADADIQRHAGQIRDYLRVTAAHRGALVYMTSGKIRWVADTVGIA